MQSVFDQIVGRSAIEPCQQLGRCARACDLSTAPPFREGVDQHVSATVIDGSMFEFLVHEADAVRRASTGGRSPRAGRRSDPAGVLGTTPPSTFISVLLPAPFAPSSACASPAATSSAHRATPRRAERFLDPSGSQQQLEDSLIARASRPSRQMKPMMATPLTTRFMKKETPLVEAVPDQRHEQRPEHRDERPPDRVDGHAADHAGRDDLQRHAVIADVSRGRTGHA